jgi:hypothetical protein
MKRRKLPFDWRRQQCGRCGSNGAKRFRGGWLCDSCFDALILEYVKDHPDEFFITADGRIGAYGTAYAPVRPPSHDDRKG